MIRMPTTTATATTTIIAIAIAEYSKIASVMIAQDDHYTSLAAVSVEKAHSDRNLSLVIDSKDSIGGVVVVRIPTHRSL